MKEILSLFFPDRCAFCGELLGKNEFEICHFCKKGVHKISGETCIHCGRGVGRCACANEEQALSRSVAVFYYEGSIKEAIQRLKFQNCPETAKILAKFQLEKVLDIYADKNFDLVVSVPMHSKKERLRGYNQSELLASFLSTWLQIPFANKALKKVKNHIPLHQLSARERRKEIENTFASGKDEKELIEKKILLVDDVYTTGATMEECAKALRLIGAKEVSGIVIAATNLNKVS